MILGLIRTTVREHSPSLLSRFSFTGVDMDIICVKMATVQILANCAVQDVSIGEVTMYRGDSLGSLDDLQCIAHATYEPEMPQAAAG